jgi:hypothetical protein
MTLRTPLLLAFLVLAAVGRVPEAAAQDRVSFFDGSVCVTVQRCRVTGGCDLGGSPLTFVGPFGRDVCVCLPDAASLPEDPSFCCPPAMSTGVTCPFGEICVASGTGPQLCPNPELRCLEPTAGGGVSSASLAQCFTEPGSGEPQASWARGDCDGDGRPNGEEVADMGDPCCDEGTDAGCCVRSGGAVVNCCEGQSDPFECCRSLAPSDPVCCAAFGAMDPACSLDGGHFEDAGGPPDGGANVDAGGAPDGGANVDAGGAPDGGAPDGGAGLDAGGSERDGGGGAMDGGAAPIEPEVSFGGGSGCRCSAGRRAPPPLPLLLGLAALLARARRVTIRRTPGRKSKPQGGDHVVSADHG